LFGYPSRPAALAPPFTHIVIIIPLATYCDPVRFRPSTSSHVIAVVVVVVVGVVAVVVIIIIIVAVVVVVTGDL
jgi:hypothetical protein